MKQGNDQDLWNGFGRQGSVLGETRCPQSVERKVELKEERMLPAVCVILTSPSIEEAF